MTTQLREWTSWPQHHHITLRQHLHTEHIPTWPFTSEPEHLFSHSPKHDAYLW